MAGMSLWLTPVRCHYHFPHPRQAWGPPVSGRSVAPPPPPTLRTFPTLRAGGNLDHTLREEQSTAKITTVLVPPTWNLPQANDIISDMRKGPTPAEQARGASLHMEATREFAGGAVNPTSRFSALRQVILWKTALRKAANPGFALSP
jgi:hypothetical protein